MQLSAKQLKRLTHGVLELRQVGEYLSFQRFTQEQVQSLGFSEDFQRISQYSAGVLMRFKTDACKISFDYKRIVGTLKDSIDVYVNDQMIHAFLMEDLEMEGRLSISLPLEKKDIAIYFPTDVEIHIKNFCIDGKWSSVKPKKCKILWIGDSITQGVGSFMGSQTFVNLVSKKANCESLNQGIGGYGYMENTLKPLPGFQADKIVVALGTNDGVDGLYKRIERFYDTLHNVYGGLPTLVITPIWRGDDSEKCSDLRTIKKMIADVCRRYENIQVVDGFDLVPPVTYCFYDNLHPNAWGMEQYANNLLKVMKRLRF